MRDGQIPIRNLFYLLVYAWELGKFDASPLNSNALPLQDSANLLAKLFAFALDKLSVNRVRLGYTNVKEQVRFIRGKIDIPTYIKAASEASGHLTCEFEDFSANTLENRIIVSAAKLLMHAGIDDDLYWQIKSSINKKLPSIETTNLNHEVFKKIDIRRLPYPYDLLINLSKLVTESSVPEDSGTGRLIVPTALKDQLPQIFETFVRNFYKEELKSCSVRSEVLSWYPVQATNEDVSFLPRMKTDISIFKDNEYLVIDTKFYKEMFQSKIEGIDKFISGNLYQLTSYLNVKRWQTKDLKLRGMLLYPAVKIDRTWNYSFPDFDLRVATVDLSKDWNQIRDQLLALVA